MLGGRFAKSRDMAIALPIAAPILRPVAAAFTARAFSAATLTIESLGGFGFAPDFRSGIL